MYRYNHKYNNTQKVIEPIVIVLDKNKKEEKRKSDGDREHRLKENLFLQNFLSFLGFNFFYIFFTFL